MLTKSLLLSTTSTGYVKEQVFIFLINGIWVSNLCPRGNVPYRKTGRPQGEAICGVEVSDLLSPDDCDEIAPSDVDSYVW